MTDPIADLIIRIQNGSAVGHERVEAPYSKIKHAIADLLKKRSYVGEVMVEDTGVKKKLILNLVYSDGRPAVNGVKRVSKPSRRLYESVGEIKKFKRGFGLSVYSTPKGVLDNFSAKKQNVGGEILFRIW